MKTKTDAYALGFVFWACVFVFVCVRVFPWQRTGPSKCPLRVQVDEGERPVRVRPVCREAGLPRWETDTAHSSAGLIKQLGPC